MDDREMHGQGRGAGLLVIPKRSDLTVGDTGERIEVLEGIGIIGEGKMTKGTVKAGESFQQNSQ